MFQEFKKFAMRGNVIDMAVGIVIGSAFGAIVTSFVSDVIMPPIGLMIGGIDFSNLYQVIKPGETPGPYASLADAQTAGAVTLNYGLFINTIITFIIIAFAVFMVVRSINKMTEKKEEPAAPTTRDCPFCLSSVALKATRCAHCTSELKAA